jgi:predicted Zn-dependent protease
VSRFRALFLVSLLVAGGALIAALLAHGTTTPLGRTLAPLLTLLGHAPKVADRALTKALPIDALDEATLGDALAARFPAPAGADARYVDRLTRELADGGDRPFAFRAFVEPGPPNAYALPGGVIVVTDALLALLRDEAELASVLGHEIGHVVLGHCYDAARFQLLARKVRGETLGELADVVYGALAHPSFSKTQEDEADRYGFELLLARGYDPMAMSDAFVALRDATGAAARRGLDPLGDYLRSHPPIELRIENFRERARRWVERHPENPLARGVGEFARRVTRNEAKAP